MKTVVVAVAAFVIGALATARAQYPYPISPRVSQELAQEEAADRGAATAPKPRRDTTPTPSLEERQVRALERIARALEGRCRDGVPAPRELGGRLPVGQ